MSLPPELLMAATVVALSGLGLALAFLWRLHRLAGRQQERMLAELYAGLGLSRSQVESSLLESRAQVVEKLLATALPPHCYRLQHTLSTGTRVDCLLLLPPPAGPLPIDAKFPLENYQHLSDPDLSAEERARAGKRFGADVRRHVDDIADRYQVPGETSEGAILFVPSEPVF